MREFILGVGSDAQVFGVHAQVDVPRVAQFDPAFEPALGFARAAEKLHLHLLELASPEDELTRRDLIAERLADLGDTEWQFEPVGPADVLIVDEDALGGLWAQIDHVLIGLDRAHVRAEHQVELLGLGEGPPFSTGRA